MTTAPVDARDVLTGLVEEAQAASERMAVGNPNRGLLLRLCACSLALAQRVARLEREIVYDDAPGRIILP